MANEIRRHVLGIGGRVQDNPLSAAATLLTSDALAAIPGGVATTTHVPIVLDPDGEDGAPEIAYLLDVTAGLTATGATGLARGKEGTTARTHKQGTPWVQAPTPDHDTLNVITKLADESVTSSTTLQDDNHLLFPVYANELWVIQAVLYVVSASATPDVKVAWSVPTGTTGWHAIQGKETAATTTDSLLKNQAHSTLTTALSAGAVASGTADALVEVRAYFSVGSTAGNIVLQWAQNASDGNATTIKAGSYMTTRFAGIH